MVLYRRNHIFYWVVHSILGKAILVFSEFPSNTCAKKKTCIFPLRERARTRTHQTEWTSTLKTKIRDFAAFATYLIVDSISFRKTQPISAECLSTMKNTTLYRRRRARNLADREPVDRCDGDAPGERLGRAAAHCRRAQLLFWEVRLQTLFESQHWSSEMLNSHFFDRESALQRNAGFRRVFLAYINISF